MDDVEFGNALVAKGLLTEDELREAIWERQRQERMGRMPPFLWDVLIQKGFLSRMQVDEALGAMQKRHRWCAACEAVVSVPKITPEGERCSKCGGPVSWRSQLQAKTPGQGDTIVALAGELPPEVAHARYDSSRVLGKYVLVEEAGHGGAGVVYKAWDMVLRQYVAIKVLRNLGEHSKLSREEQIRDLIREARSAIKLRHPNIVPVFDAGLINGQFYICMEYIDGDSLSAHVRASHKRGSISPLYEDPVRYLEVMRDVASALHYAHTFPKPIVHCDVKPGNILLDTQGRPYIVDFGLARQGDVRSEPDPEQETGGPHLVRGTPAYMAPEQLSGRPEDLGPWTDVYAMGSILYELLTGRPVFLGNAYEVMMKALREQPKRPSEVLGQNTEERPTHDSTSRILLKMTKVESLTMKCIAKERLRRCSSAQEIAEELDRIVGVLRSRNVQEQKKAVPQVIQKAQADAEMRNVEDHVTAFDLEVAFKELADLEAAWRTGDLAQLAADNRRQVKCLESFKDRLIEQMNARRPKLERVDLLDREVPGAEVLRATRRMMVVFYNGQTVEIVWQALRPEQLITIAWDVLRMEAPEDRLALGIYCKNARLMKQARFYLQSLIGTPLEEAGKALLAALRF